MIDAKKAVELAIQYFRSVSLGTPGPWNITVEEVELSEDETSWLVTLGYTDSPTQVIVGGAGRRYKIFRIDATSGRVLSMKIRPAS